MATLVEAQDVAIIKIEDDAKQTQLDMEIGYATFVCPSAA